MKQKIVEVQELGENLNRLLQEVNEGTTLVITEQGKPIARIFPADVPAEERLRQLAESGIISWSGRKLSPDIPTFPVRGEKTATEMLLEDRD